MKDKKNIVIKVSYPVSGIAAGKSAPKMITEWNVKKITLAAGALVVVLVLVSLFFAKSDDTPKTDSVNLALPIITTEMQATPQLKTKDTEIKNLDLSKKTITEASPQVKSKKELNKAAGIPIKEAIKKPANKNLIKERDYSHNVQRATLTYEINNKEPADEIKRIIKVSRKNPTWIYYFTELKAMNGTKVYHEWLKNDVIVSRKKLVISGDTWRTSSRMLLSDSEKGKWAVRLVDENSRLLNEKIFKVE